MQFNAQLDKKSVKDLERRLRKLGFALDRNTKIQILRPIVNRVLKPVAKQKTPIGLKVKHHRYFRGGGWAATYYRGNLRASIRAITFKRSSAVFLGNKTRKGAAARGIFIGSRADGYYGRFLEGGSKAGPRRKKGIPAVKFMEKTYLTAGNRVLDEIEKETTKILASKARRQRLTIR